MTSTGSTDPAWSDRHLVLVDLMGSGKTTVGGVLAERLQRPLVDSDHRIESSTGRTAKQILAADGLEELRRHGVAALFDALTEPRPLVIAAAAGVVLDAESRRRLVEAPADVVWLDADPALLPARTSRHQHRPWLDDDPAGTLQRMHLDRQPLYFEVADAIVTVGGLTPVEIADRIVP